MARGVALADRDPRGSIVALGAGAELLAAAGAEWRRDLAPARLRRGERSGKQVAAATLGARSITGRELGVARLGANRLSSAEIAARLFISHRTVETHLASVYTNCRSTPAADWPTNSPNRPCKRARRVAVTGRRSGRLV
jgi:DNA-binding CsgD family transcriptional regulator